MAKYDQKLKKKSSHKFDDDEYENFASERKVEKKARREYRQRDAEHTGQQDSGLFM